MFCSSCGNQLPDDSRFCDRCGAATDALAQAARPTQTAYVPTNQQAPSNPQSSQIYNVGEPMTAVLDKNWPIIACLLASGSALFYFIMQVSYTMWWQNPFNIINSAALAILAIAIAKKKAVITAIPLAVVILLRFIALCNGNSSAVSVLYFLIFAAIFTVCILGVLDKFPNKQLSFIIISGLTIIYLLISLANIRAISSVLSLLANILFLGSYLILSYAVSCTNDVEKFKGFAPASGNQHDNNVQTYAQQPVTPPAQYNQPTPASPVQVSTPTYASATPGDFFSIGEYVIDEKVSAFKFTNAYKVFDTAGRQIGAVEQQKISGGAKAARLLTGSNVKAMQSFKLDITDAGGSVLVSIQRGGVGARGGIRNINILNSSGRSIGSIKILFSWLTPKLEIRDQMGQPVGLIQGDWKGWNFNITDFAGNVIGTVNKKWAGAMKEMFTTADKYHVSISPNANGAYRQTIIAAAITIDMVLKESK